MGRGQNRSDYAVALRQPGPLAERPMTIEEVFANAGRASDEPDWRLPNEFYLNEARQFITPATMPDDPEILAAWRERLGREPTMDDIWQGVDIDHAVATRLTQLQLDGSYDVYRRWLEGSPSLIKDPEATCPGMYSAAGTINAAIHNGDKIAVFCDYDVDGLTAGHAFALALEPYDADLHYGYAGAGFGLTNAFVEEAAAAGAKLLITLDCGSGQNAQVALAQSLGMKVIVVDHHGVNEDNPADHHLNPLLHEPVSSHNTGAQLAWKLGAAVQIAREGRTREEHWQEAMYAAGMGCLADMGSVLLPENRSFFWHPHEHPPIGVQVLAEMLGEDPRQPGGLILTQAALNLPKRMPELSTADNGALIAARTREDAQPLAERLVAVYDRARPVREEMVAKALEQTGVKKMIDEREFERPNPDDRFAVAVLRGYEDYSGYTGPVAQKVAAETAKPALVFAYKGTDDLGQNLYRMSSRPDWEQPIGLLAEDPAMREAMTIKRVNEAGEIVEEPVIGGHNPSVLKPDGVDEDGNTKYKREYRTGVTAGTCTEENLPRAIAAAQAWAMTMPKAKWFKPVWDGPDANLTARKLSPERLQAAESDARRLAPFARAKQLLVPADELRGVRQREAKHGELLVSVMGKLSVSEPDPDNEDWLQGRLELEDGSFREIRYPADAEQRPVGDMCEWVLRLGRTGPYYLRLFHKPVS